MVQETFYLKDEPKKLLQNCSESTRSEIDLIYPQKKVIPVTWYYWRQTRPYVSKFLIYFAVVIHQFHLGC